MPEVVVYIAEGRSNEQKKALMKNISDAVVRHTGVPIDAVIVSLMETPKQNKAKGGVPFSERAPSAPAKAS